MNIEGYPMLGTPKQNSFIIKLGGALGFTSLQEAVNVGLNRPPAQPLSNPFTMADASTVITALLEKCKAAGISTFSASGKGGKRKRSGKRGAPAPAPAPDPQPAPLPLPGIPHPAATPDITRAGYTVEQLAEELVRRNADEVQRARLLEKLPTDWLCGELERRGLPGGFLLTDPDAVAVAPRALEWMDFILRDVPKGRQSDGATILREAGREVID